ncbi:MAG: hypothetical protein ACE5EQ_06485 [Phycisphaerae bacterium]
MKNNPKSAAVRDLLSDTRYAIILKLPHDLRHKVNQCIIDRTLRPLSRIFDFYALYQYAISQSAFYRYARNYRARVAQLELATITEADGVDLPERILSLFGTQLLEALVLNDPDHDQVRACLEAYRLAAQTICCLRKQPAPEIKPIQDKRLFVILDELKKITNAAGNNHSLNLNQPTRKAKPRPPILARIPDNE